jgi:hypothetical protein
MLVALGRQSPAAIRAAFPGKFGRAFSLGCKSTGAVQPLVLGAVGPAEKRRPSAAVPAHARMVAGTPLIIGAPARLPASQPG